MAVPKRYCKEEKKDLAKRFVEEDNLRVDLIYFFKEQQRKLDIYVDFDSTV